MSLQHKPCILKSIVEEREPIWQNGKNLQQKQ